MNHNFGPTDTLDLWSKRILGRQQFAKGDTKVALCIDCHGVRSTFATTCARCHAGGAYMKGYSVSTGQFAKYSVSVHHDALAVRGASARRGLIRIRPAIHSPKRASPSIALKRNWSSRISRKV